MLPLIALPVLLMQLSGCVQAERTRYARHLATVVEPVPADDGDVALSYRSPARRR